MGNVAVIGGTGLVGRHVVELLSRRGTESVTATYRSRAPFDAPGVRWVRADMRDRMQAAQALEGCKAAVLCAGRVSTSAVLRSNPIESILDTLYIVTNALEACAVARVARVVLVSSCTVYPGEERVMEESAGLVGDPPDAWFGVGWMHRYLEKQLEWYVRRLALIASGAVLRPTLVYGPYDDFDVRTGHFVPSFVRQVVERVKPIQVFGDGEQTRNLVHAGDLARAVDLALNPSDDAFQIFNVATDDEVSVRSFLRLLLEIDGFQSAAIEFVEKSGGPSKLQISGNRLSAMTGWRPTIGLRDGLTDLLSWYRTTQVPSAGTGATKGRQPAR